MHRLQSTVDNKRPRDRRRNTDSDQQRRRRGCGGKACIGATRQPSGQQGRPQTRSPVKRHAMRSDRGRARRLTGRKRKSPKHELAAFVKGTGRFSRRWRTQSQMEEAMLKRLLIVVAIICTPALAETTPDTAVLGKSRPIGQTVKDERIYGLDCAAINNTA